MSKTNFNRSLEVDAHSTLGKRLRPKILTVQSSLIRPAL